MTPTEVTELIDVCAAAYRQQADPRDQMIWSAAIGDLSFNLARRAVVEWIRTSPYWPRPADLRERARLIAAQDAREKAKHGQIEARGASPVIAGRTGAEMVRHVLGRLKDAGSDPENGKYIGSERCADIAEEAAHEWLQQTALKAGPGATLRSRDGGPNALYKPEARRTGGEDYYDTQATAGAVDPDPRD
jgi:hypothetical protein